MYNVIWAVCLQKMVDIVQLFSPMKVPWAQTGELKLCVDPQDFCMLYAITEIPTERKWSLCGTSC